MNLRKVLSATVCGLGCALFLSLGAFITSSAAPADAHITTMATTAPLNMREMPGLNGYVMTVIPEGTSVRVYSMTNDGWYNVEYDGMKGYSYYQYLNFEGTADGTAHDGNVTKMYATDPLNVREQPNTYSRILGSLKINEGIEITGKQDGWFKVKFNGHDAYCFGEYLEFGQDGPEKEATVENSMMNAFTTTAPLNIRIAPNMNAQILGSYAPGEIVHVIGMEGDWAKVKYGNVEAYCHADYLQ